MVLEELIIKILYMKVSLLKINGMDMEELFSKMEAIILAFGKMIKNKERVFLLRLIKNLEKLLKNVEFGIKILKLILDPIFIISFSLDCMQYIIFLKKLFKINYENQNH